MTPSEARLVDALMSPLIGELRQFALRARWAALDAESYGGVAFYFAGPECASHWSAGGEEYEEDETGNALMIMVGDDRRFSIDPDDITPLEDLAYCASCGQIGCTADDRDRSAE